MRGTATWRKRSILSEGFWFEKIHDMFAFCFAVEDCSVPGSRQTATPGSPKVECARNELVANFCRAIGHVLVAHA